MGERIEVGDLRIDAPAHTATLKDLPLALTSFEFRLVGRLGPSCGRDRNPRRARRRCSSQGASYDPSVDRSLDVHVSHLRHKLGDEAREPKRIRTVRGVGYILVKPM